MRKVVVASLLSFLCLAFTAPVRASLVLPSSLERMTNASDAVVEGRVLSKESFSDGTTIFTTVAVAVDDWVKAPQGAPPARIEVTVLGGTVGSVTQTVDMSPRFMEGEHVVLFLKERASESGYVLYGLYYGKCNVEADEDGLSFTVTGPVFSAGHTYEQGARVMKKNDLPPGGEGLLPFKARVRGMVSK